MAERFMPLYEASNGKYGYVSIQGDPFDESEGQLRLIDRHIVDPKFRGGLLAHANKVIVHNHSLLHN